MGSDREGVMELGKALRTQGFPDLVERWYQPATDRVTLVHKDSGFTREYGREYDPKDNRSTLMAFARELFTHLTTDEREARDVYHDPHIVLLRKRDGELHAR